MIRIAVPGSRARGAIRLAALVLFACSATIARAQTPTQPVSLLHDALVASMKLGDTQGFDGRYAVVAPAVRGSFDLEGVARRVIGRHWQRLSEAERGALADRLSELAIVTLAARFDDFDDERFVTEEVVPLKGGAQRVRSIIAFSDGGTVRLDYAVHAADGGWRIFNIWFDGVSGTRIKRDEFDGLLRRDGAQALIERLDEQIAQMAGR